MESVRWHGLDGNWNLYCGDCMHVHECLVFAMLVIMDGQCIKLCGIGKAERVNDALYLG